MAFALWIQHLPDIQSHILRLLAACISCYTIRSMATTSGSIELQYDVRFLWTAIRFAVWRIRAAHMSCNMIAAWRKTIAAWRKTIVAWRNTIAAWQNTIVVWRLRVAQMSSNIVYRYDKPWVFKLRIWSFTE